MEHDRTIWFCRDIIFEHFYLERHDCLSVCLSIDVFISIIDYRFEPYKSLYVHATQDKNVMNMIGNIPHQKFYFYHFPTRGRAGIKLGDA